MIVCETKSHLREVLAQSRARARHLVPTMGALHEGHCQLIREARIDAEALVIVTIFVNPKQFGEGEDFSRYPRTLEGDLAQCQELGVDVVFAPSASEMYAEDHSVIVSEGALSQRLCGASRPGHFNGVSTVVTKLLALVQPQRSFFGQKDYQQLKIIQRLCRDLDFDIEIVGVPTVREKDGLAMSSRNAFLTGKEREEAAQLNRFLNGAQKRFESGERNAETIVSQVKKEISGLARARVDYVELLDAEVLSPIARIEKPALLAIAVFFGEARLIDNCLLIPREEEGAGHG